MTPRYASGPKGDDLVPRIGDVVMNEISEIALVMSVGTTYYMLNDGSNGDWPDDPSEYELLSRDGEAVRVECEDCHGLDLYDPITGPYDCPTCHGKGWRHEK